MSENEPQHEPTEPKAPSEAAESSDAPLDPLDDDVSFVKTVLQFFVIPAFVVAVCVGVFLFFAWLVSSDKTGVDYLNEIRTGSDNRRWQAAFELSKIITMKSEQETLEGLVPQMIDAFQRAGDDDPRVRHYLAISLGHLGDRDATPVLVEALGDSDPATRLYAAWALGAIDDPRAVAPLLRAARDDDAGVRKVAVYSLGAIGDPSANEGLQVALSDPERDVSWNAAISLAQLGDPAGESQLMRMLDREFMDSVADMDEAQKLLTMESAIKGAGHLGGGPLVAQLEAISESDPNLGIRRAALEALEAIRSMETSHEKHHP